MEPLSFSAMVRDFGQYTADMGDCPPIFLLGATSIVGYNVALRRGGEVKCLVTSRSRHRAVAGWPRLALHDDEDLGVFCRGLPAGSVIIYCDAVCDVAKCEEDPAWAININLGNLARTLEKLPPDARLVYMSSDHVFGNDGIFNESSEPCPISRYGAMRVRAEQMALSRAGSLVIRSGLPIGRSVDGRSGHLEWLQYRLGRGLPVTIIEDEARVPVPLDHLADRIVALAKSGIVGIRHVVTDSLMSRPALAQHLKRYFQLPGTLVYRLRREQPAPHLGRIHLVTQYCDTLAAALPCPLTLISRRPWPAGESKADGNNLPPLSIHLAADCYDG